MYKKLSALCICFPLAACGINAQEQEGPKETPKEEKTPIPEKQLDAFYHFGGTNMAVVEFTPEGNPQKTCMMIVKDGLLGQNLSPLECFDKPQPVQP